ncbi:MAG: gluconokinase [Microcella sp.]|uniref:gluconokinase n=1 Tax=Microcella sp. TaxID=1913979 RepID=UPI0024C6AEA3|nr:gluconokinase [Microcella sp.]UYN85116.1 MAG: gluconokinase [Microcella sp.]
MGVSGAGKTTIGLAASAVTGVTFLDADDRHPPQNVAKMAAGIPLDDDDRAPWLDAVGAALRDEAPCIMACSALRRSYRDRLRQHAPGTLFVLLQVPRTELERRTATRDAHFMPATLLDSQLATLEPPDPAEGIVVLDATRPIDALAADVALLLDTRVD